MESMFPRGAELIDSPIRPLKRVEYERLARDGFFDDERVELLFGMVVAMTPPDPEHTQSVWRVEQLLREQLAGRAQVQSQSPFAVEVYRDRRQTEWGSITRHGRGELVSSLAIPDVRIPVDDVLPPRGR